MPGDVSKYSSQTEDKEEVEMSIMASRDPDHDSAPTAPLIEREDDQRETRNTPQTGGGNAFIWTLTLAACIGGLLFGYDTGVISSTLVSIGTDLSDRHLTSLDKGLITASTSFFALIASPFAGFFADRLGRKSIIIFSDILFTAGALWQAFTTSVWGMILGRSVVGLAIGGASMIVPLYIAELAPGHLRGRLTTVQLLLITGGQAVAYIIGWSFSSMPGGWRWMVGIGAIPAITQIFMLALMPETPRYLARIGQEEKARQILRKVYRNTTTDLTFTVDTTLAAIKKEILEEEDASTLLKQTTESPSSNKFVAGLTSLLTHPPHTRALVIACLLQGLQQAAGFNSLMYFSATIFQSLGFTNPTLTSLSIALTNFAFTVVAFYLIDRLGRRRSLLYTIPIMAVSLLLAAVMFRFVDLRGTEGAPAAQAGSVQPGLPHYLIVVALLLYVSSYATGLGPVPWQQSELFPLSVRSLGSSLSTATNWGLNTIVGLTFLPMMQGLTPTWTFVVYAAVCAVGWLAIWWCYPETMGMEIEEIGGLLQDGWGVKESMERLKRLKRAERRSGIGG
ncbi:hypothetical protein PMZ80_001117 [Knufia obscura]|uniref:Major facilitator superfamily (MFS) profile domain-containing protein n=2 Tax=Knufia TaxID=430999 RepID=A0AAN8EN05_9EURO|nr:hypothetical protein PMZ80_001117 [Knufia obscura]KAK5958818.1 hypothetical protein OHC33_000661 [Knufia fluminis]